jgi:hypothetical protein
VTRFYVEPDLDENSELQGSRCLAEGNRSRENRLSFDELGFCDRSNTVGAFELVDELRRMLNVLRRKLATRK